MFDVERRNHTQHVKYPDITPIQKLHDVTRGLPLHMAQIQLDHPLIVPPPPSPIITIKERGKEFGAGSQNSRMAEDLVVSEDETDIRLQWMMRDHILRIILYVRVELEEVIYHRRLR